MTVRSVHLLLVSVLIVVSTFTGGTLCAQSPRIARLPQPPNWLRPPVRSSPAPVRQVSFQADEGSLPPNASQRSLLLVAPDASQRLLANRQPRSITIEQLTLDTLQHSLQIKILAADVHEVRNRSGVARAQFDWRSFIESSWRDANQPVGSTLDTGDSNGFLRTHDFSYQMGVRKKNRLGGEFQVGQQYRLENSNSSFFSPAQQGTATLQLTYDQPLLRGGGRLVQEGMVVVTQLRADAARDSTLKGIQDHLLSVYDAYWSLWNARAKLIKLREAHSRAEEILRVLHVREKVDGEREPILRTESALALRRTALIQAEREVLNRQARLRLLVNSPLFQDLQSVELLPLDQPWVATPLPALTEAFDDAVRHRPDVSQALLNVKSGGIERDIAQHELLPELSLVLESYVRGLQGDFNVGGAFKSQFREGDPTYSVALEFEAPWYNRAARAELQRRRWVLQRLRDEFQLALETVWLDVDMALRDATTSQREIDARRLTVERLTTQWRYSEERFRLMLTDGKSTALYLEDLLNVQSRLADAEAALAQSRSEYAIAALSLRRATGTLLEYAPQ
jgi:outer membrane protein TolC